jgi:hypothetical protein
MKETFIEIVELLKTKLEKYDFIPKGKDTFVRKNKDFNREDRIVFSYRKGKGAGFENTIYIAAIANITFPDVNKEEKIIIKDHLSAYPLIAGSIKHFYDPDPGYLSIQVDGNTNIDSVAKEIIYYVENGAFKLFEKYKSLGDILHAIDNDDKNFNDFNKFLDFRNAIRVATIRYRIDLDFLP